MSLIVSPPPITLLNGTIADATQVMADLLATINQVNANAAHSGNNSDITQLSGLTTPITPAQGGSIVFSGGVSAGTASTQTCATTTPINFTFTQGYGLIVQAGVTNSGPLNLAVAGTAGVNVKKYNSAGVEMDLVSGDWVTGNVYYLGIDGINYILANPTTNSSGSLHGIPAGGTTGQVLTKNSNADYDASWQTLTGGGAPTGASAFTGVFQSGQHAFAYGTLLTVAHGLGKAPDMLYATLVCQTNDGGYAAGAQIPIVTDAVAGASATGRALYADASNVYFLHNTQHANGDLIGTGTFAAGGPTPGVYNINAANWKIQFLAVSVGGGLASPSSLIPLGKGSVDTSNSTALLDLRTFVANDTYERIIIEIDNIVTTGGSGTSNIYFEWAQQGTANSASSYGQLSDIGIGVGSANFNQAPTSVCKILQTSGDNLADGKATMKLYGFCSTTVKKWQSLFFQAFGYDDNATVASRVMATGFNEIWGNGGDDSKVTDGLKFFTAGFTKATFNFQVFGLKAQ